MKVGIVGSGIVGRTLAGGFAGRGHEVVVGTRTPSNPDLVTWASTVKGKVTVKLGSFADAAGHGELVVLAVPGGSALAALKLAGAAHFSGKTLIDVTNPLDFSKGMPPSLLFGTSDSLGERVQKEVPAAKVVKAFNTVGNPQMVDPHVKGQPRLELMIAGNDPAAKEQVTEIVKSFGWYGTIDVGGIEGSRWLEAVVPLWVRAGAALNTWTHVWLVARD